MSSVRAAEVTPALFAATGEEAFVYGFPLVMHYDVWHDYFIDATSSVCKAPSNQT